MAKTCFCGCGRPIGLASRKLNRHGELLSQLLMGIHGLVLPKLDPEPGFSDDGRRAIEQARANMESFADEGSLFRVGLIEVLHDETSIRDFDHPRMMAWIRGASEANRLAMRRT